MEFRKLNASEIDVRVATVTAKGCSLLLYKDARVDQNILDESVGAENWQRTHEVIGGNLYCTVSIWDNKKSMWISKQDVGTESYTEKEKGQASDSFKRACFNWGIGRELYTAPFIWITPEGATIEPKDNKFTTRDTFKVNAIGYDNDGNINYLTIWNNKKKKIVFSMGSPDYINVTEQETLKSMIEKRGLDLEKVLNGIPIDKVTGDMYTDAIKKLSRIKEVKK